MLGGFGVIPERLPDTAAFFITNPADLADDLYRDGAQESDNL
jgi:hypothetical protein